MEKHLPAATGLQRSSTGIETVTNQIHKRSSRLQGKRFLSWIQIPTMCQMAATFSGRLLAASHRTRSSWKTAVSLCAQVKGVKKGVYLSQLSDLGCTPGFGEMNTRCKTLKSRCQFGRNAAKIWTVLLKV